MSVIITPLLISFIVLTIYVSRFTEGYNRRLARMMAFKLSPKIGASINDSPYRDSEFSARKMLNGEIRKMRDEIAKRDAAIARRDTEIAYYAKRERLASQERSIKNGLRYLKILIGSALCISGGFCFGLYGASGSEQGRARTAHITDTRPTTIFARPDRETVLFLAPSFFASQGTIEPKILLFPDGDRLRHQWLFQEKPQGQALSLILN
jgi:hypothetical protein